MARAPRWTVDLSPAGRSVLAHGLPSAHPGSGIRVATESHPGAPLADDEWNALVVSCAQHGLQGLFAAAVADGSLATTTMQAREVAEIEIGLSRARINQELVLAEVADALYAEGIGFLVMKGLAFAALVYPDPSWRPTGDLDLLVRPDLLPEAIDVLERLGGTRFEVEPAEGFDRHVTKSVQVDMPGTGIEADLHRRLVGGCFGSRIPIDDPFRASVPFLAGMRTYRAPPVDESLLLAALHLLIEGYRRALSLRDVAQLALHPDLDSDRVVSLAERWRVETPLAVALAMVERDLGAVSGLPLTDWARGFRPPPLDLLWLRAEQPENQLMWTRRLGTVIGLPTWRERRIRLRALLAPRRGTWPSLTTRVGRKLRLVATETRW